MPEPDPARMQATITAARARFADPAPAPPPAPRRLGWRIWLAPAAGALAALAVVALLMPQPDAPQLADGAPSAEGRGLAREPVTAPDRLAEPPPVRDGASEPGAPPGRVMGARPPQAMPPPDDALPAIAQRHDFDGFQVAVRAGGDSVTLSFLRDGAELAFDRRSLDPGVGFALLDAFLLAPPDEPELLLVQSRVGTAVNWDVFTVRPDGIRLSAELSRRVHDAPDRAAVAGRLAAPE
ncbi:hypothetical protein [Paracoccus thiocyanatus]|uniref:hypothetical protein n=1 Tax=Paracoccus thiocyanatus TaxID=34006 RepID=UPI00122C9004|nr:hypothetical protein [Paracoccus thiocyanatus]